MIISASRRTDIPTFHSEWFFNRLREGYSITTHRPGTGTYYRVPLTPDVVDCIVFRTKNPEPMFARLDELQDYKYLFNITINPYGREMEAHVPPLEYRIATYKKLSDRIGAQRMTWHYDPVMISPKYDLNFHRQAFEYLCRELAPFSYRCMIEFIEHYPFVARRIDSLEVRRRSEEDMRAIGRIFGKIAHRYGLQLETCATEGDLDEFGIGHGACFDRKQIEDVVGYQFGKVREGYLRPHCGCMESVDIGHYSTCGNGCLYCYASRRKIKLDGDPLNPSLDPDFDAAFAAGKILSENIIEQKCHSLKPAQMGLW